MTTSWLAPMKLIDCHDCGSPVSLNARWCPRCGSKDFAGPVRASRRARIVGAEARNDRTLVLMVTALGSIGALYGIETGSGWMREAVGALVYGFIGVVAAVPIAFAVNITRGWR
jgi:hypothetical protein